MIGDIGEFGVGCENKTSSRSNHACVLGLHYPHLYALGLCGERVGDTHPKMTESLGIEYFELLAVGWRHYIGPVFIWNTSCITTRPIERFSTSKIRSPFENIEEHYSERVKEGYQNKSRTQGAPT